MAYDRQLVVALIDGRKIKHHGAEIDWGNPQAFLDDLGVTDADKQEARRQLGELETAEYLHEKQEATSTLLVIDDYDPAVPADVSGKMITGMAGVVALPQSSRLYLIGHHDPDTLRMAGLNPDEMARALAMGRKVNRVKRITLVACHTAGEAGSAAAAQAFLDPEARTYASRLHHKLGKTYGIFCDLAGYTSYVTISARGQKMVRFDEGAARGNKVGGTKILYSWDQTNETFRQVPSMVYDAI